MVGNERERLERARSSLLLLHAALLQEERIRYERERGRIEGSGALLQLVIHDPWFAWLHPISEVITQIDELLDETEPAAPSLGATLLAQVRDLLRPDATGDAFRRRYYELVQDAPAVALAHAEARKVLALQ